VIEVTIRFDVRGPSRHGCVRHARQVRALVRRPGVVTVASGAADITHAQFTDALWGPDIAHAAAAYEAWARTVPRPLMVTLHDLPGGDDDIRRGRRRASGYARVLAESDGVIVSSRHEAERVARLGGPPARVIPLPLPEMDRVEGGGRPEWAGGTPSVGLLGFLYPGKGHDEVIDAASRQSGPLQVVSLGAVSPGHAALHRRLITQATQLGVGLVVTGRLSDRAMRAAVDAVTVPVVANRVVSASASLMAWIGGLRHPLVVDSPFSCELDAAYPGLLTRYRTIAELSHLIDLAVGDPARTRLSQRPDWADIGGAHLDAYADLLSTGRRS
jgi:hypothetical protein